MQKKRLFNAGIIGLVLVASFLALKGSNGSTEREKVSPTCCKKTEKRCSGQAQPETPKTGLEHLSHQFISLPAFLH